jgi:hypothetical protein
MTIVIDSSAVWTLLFIELGLVTLGVITIVIREWLWDRHE